MTAEEPVGTVADEAAKLFAALHTWAGEHTAGERSTGEPGEPAGQPDECRWCPICQLVRYAKATSPDVRDHLTQAGLSIVLAIKAVLEESDPPTRRGTPVEKIDLTEE